MLNIIPTRIHGVIDYITAITLIAAPFLFGFADGTSAQWVPTVLGLVIIGQSLITDYEWSLAKILSMPAHLGLDVAGAVMLIASPWLFGFADRVYLPHVLVGLAEIAVVILSSSRRGRR